MATNTVDTSTTLFINTLFFIVPVLVLLMSIMFLGVYIYSNKQLINELEEDYNKQNTKIKNIIDAVNYNDKKLYENQKYIYTIYEENNNFENSLSENDSNHNNSDQYYNMMKNYDALIRLTK
jgi:ABC-type transport system involved in multi-copper enzyme maturation permease subunit